LQAHVPPPKHKGKEKVSQSLVPSVADEDDLSEGTIVSERELEYDENVSIEESDDSASDFEASEDESEEDFVIKTRKIPNKRSLPIMDEGFLDDEDDDEIMIDAAIRESLRTVRLDSDARNGIGSSRSSVPSNPAAALRAAAAELRLARASHVIDVDAFEEPFSISDSDTPTSSDEEALPKSKGKTSKKSATIRDTISTKFMSMSERRKLNSEQRKLASAARRENRKEENAMVKQLGRKLTYVRIPTSSNSFSEDLNPIQAEKSTIALRKQHPELKDVWGDLEKSIPIVVPQKAEQPANLKVTLLPFQQESLFWMRKQEQGVWHGGMLAVRLRLLPIGIFLTIFFCYSVQDEMG
jgi:DNA repair protein RAD16